MRVPVINRLVFATQQRQFFVGARDNQQCIAGTDVCDFIATSR
jgi:hypothetical protein